MSAQDHQTAVRRAVPKNGAWLRGDTLWGSHAKLTLCERAVTLEALGAVPSTSTLARGIASFRPAGHTSTVPHYTLLSSIWNKRCLGVAAMVSILWHSYIPGHVRLAIATIITTQPLAIYAVSCWETHWLTALYTRALYTSHTARVLFKSIL